MEENPKIAPTQWQCKPVATEAKHPRIKGGGWNKEKKKEE
jgi:hypothetical protein